MYPQKNIENVLNAMLDDYGLRGLLDRLANVVEFRARQEIATVDTHDDFGDGPNPEPVSKEDLLNAVANLRGGMY